MYKSYVAVAPKVEDFPRLLQAVGDTMRRDLICTRLPPGVRQSTDRDMTPVRKSTSTQSSKTTKHPLLSSRTG